VRHSIRFARLLGAALAVLFAGTLAAVAQDRISIAIGQRGNWETSVAELGIRSGVFARHGIELDIVYTQGSGETIQTVISGAVNVGVGPSVTAVLSAYSRGAPIRVIGATATGARDLYWYVRADSALQNFSDIAGQSVAYSTTGASTHEVVKALADQYGVELRPTATGSPASTLTQVMAGLIDVGWSAPPFGLEQLDEGQIRILASGDDAMRFQGQTVRFLTVNARALAADPDLFERFMTAYRETLDWMYVSPEAIAEYADFAGITEARALRTRDDFFPKDRIDPNTIVGLEDAMQTAVELGYMRAVLGPDQIDELIRIPANQ